jgi:protein-tyrosine phosphatase
MRRILFLCTGNYYRSRYAEALFNHEAARCGLDWCAFSRGLAVDLAPPGLSPHTARRLIERGIPCNLTGPDPVQVGERDLLRAARVIALKGPEHRPLIKRLHPAWADRIEYWEINDLDVSTPKAAMDAIEAHVAALVAELGSGETQKGESPRWD